MNSKALATLSLASLALPFVLFAQRAPQAARGAGQIAPAARGAGPAATATTAAETPVAQLQNLAHTVDSLEKTVPFYRDVIGLTGGRGDPLAAQPTALNEDMSKFTGTRGMKFRSATFRIPGAPFGFELTEFTGGPRKSGVPNLQDIGAATLVVRVKDMDKMVAKLKAANTTIVTIGGAPLNRELLVRDPDGFFVELQQGEPAAGSTDTGDVIGGSVQLSIEDSAKTVAFLKDAIGFQARPTGALGTNATVANLIGLPGAQWRITHGSIPGTTLDFGLIEYSGVPRKKFTLGAEDPGSPAFTMVVRDIDAAVEQWTKAGGTVASTGGKAIKAANGSGNVFVRDVNGFMWELIARGTAAPRGAAAAPRGGPR